LSTTTKLSKRHAGVLVAGLTLSIAILAALLSGWAEAQEVDSYTVSSLETAQNANSQTNPPAAANTATQQQQQQATYEPAAPLVVIEPGDSLWAIAQERLGPNATPQQVANEVDRIYGLNQNQIGNNPDLIFPGQELLLTRGTEPAPGASITGFAEAAESAPAEPAVAEEPATAEQPTAVEVAPEPKDEPAPQPAPSETADERATEDGSKAANVEPSYPVPGYTDREAPSALTLLLSFGFFLCALAVAAFGVLKLLRRRKSLGERYKPSAHHVGYYDRFRLLEQEEEEETSEPEVAEPAAEERISEPAAETTPKIPAPSREANTLRLYRGHPGIVWRSLEGGDSVGTTQRTRAPQEAPRHGMGQLPM
jgi:hypothetical protein